VMKGIFADPATHSEEERSLKKLRIRGGRGKPNLWYMSIGNGVHTYEPQHEEKKSGGEKEGKGEEKQRNFVNRLISRKAIRGEKKNVQAQQGSPSCLTGLNRQAREGNRSAPSN